MFRIALDLSGGRGDHSGAATYTRNLLGGLAAVDRQSRYSLFGNPAMKGMVEMPNFRYIPYDELDGIDIWHFPDLASPHIRHCARRLFNSPRRGEAMVVTVHDLLFETHASEFSEGTRQRLAGNLLAAVLAGASFITPSGWTASEFISRLGVRDGDVAIIPLAAAPEFSPIEDQEALLSIRRKYGLWRPYVLTVTGFFPRKNLSGAITGFALSEAERLRAAVRGIKGLVAEGGIQLVVVGIDADQAPRLVRGIPASAWHTGRVRILGKVPLADMPLLYNAAEVLLYPSRAEGFGLPVIEAMACGLPVITSRTSALPETAGGAALLVDPDDPEDIANALRSVLEDQDLSRRLGASGLARAKQLSWERTARMTLAFYMSRLGCP